MGLLQRIFKNLNNSLKTFRFAMTVTVNFSSLRGRESGCCNQFNYNHERGVKNYYIMSCADGGNFLCKKFHKTIHTLHSIITCKLNEPHERSAELSSENVGCLQDFSDDTESRLTRMWLNTYETVTVFCYLFH